MKYVTLDKSKMGIKIKLNERREGEKIQRAGVAAIGKVLDAVTELGKLGIIDTEYELSEKTAIRQKNRENFKSIIS
jgi:hypothetical protein